MKKNKLNNLAVYMSPKDEFLEAFEDELKTCYSDARRANIAGDEKQAAVALSQAEVWERLVKLISGN